MPFDWVLFAIIMAINAVAMGISYLLRPRAETGPAMSREFNAPTVSADRVIPTFWGKCKIDSPNLVWYGNLSHDEDHAGGQVIGLQDVLTLHYVIALGQIDNLHEIKFEDKEAWTGTSAGGTSITIDTD